MSLITSLINNTAYSMEDAFGAKDCTSQAMRKAILDWFELYMQEEPTEKEDPCQRIPYTVVNKLYKTSFSEYKATSEDEFAQAVITALDRKKKKAMQMALIGGECLIKPVPLRDGWRFTVVNRSNIMVFARDDDGVPTDIGTVERTVSSRSYYTLLERRTVDGAGYLTITNKLYRSSSEGALGSPVSLQELPKYADLVPAYTFAKPIGLGVVRMVTPMENCVDGGNDAVSVYAAAVGLIHNINQNEAQINGEFKRGESRILASADLLKKDTDGRRQFADHLFVGLDDDAEAVGVTIFSPVLREQSFLARKTEYLRNVENVIGLKRGLLSEVEAADRTAKEITSSEGDYNLTIIDFQNMWEAALRETVHLCGALGQLYHVKGAHEVDLDKVTVDWGNGVLYDEDKTWADYKDMVARNLLKPEIAVGWRFGMPTETPDDLAAVREKYMPEVDALLEGE